MLSLDIGTVLAAARRITTADGLTFEEGSLQAEGVRLDVADSLRLRVETAQLRLAITEVEANRAIQGLDLGPVTGLRAAFLTGRVRLTGRYRLVARIAAPFTLVAALEPRAGLTVALDVQELSVVGLPNPAIVANAVEDRINARLSEASAAANLPFPARLERLTLEPGRLIVSLAATLDLAPRSSAPQISGGGT